MAHTVLSALVLLLLLAAERVSADDPAMAREPGPATVRLRTSISPPYQVLNENDLEGISIDVLECVFNRMKTPHQVVVVPWVRALADMQTGLADGYFASMRFESTDRYALLSAPLALEKWYWAALRPAVLDKSPADPSLRIGTLSGSIQSAWLTGKGYTPHAETRTFEQLFLLLERDRIDTILADESAIEAEVARVGIEPDRLSLRFERYTPLGMYFTHRFLDANPGFLSQFNFNLYPCAPDVSRLSLREETLLEQMAEKQIAAIAAQPALLKALRAKRRKLGPVQIAALDQRWRDEFASGEYDLIRKLINAKPSGHLRRIREASNGLFTELILMDAIGMNVGISDVTSDMWQGDEDKFLQTLGAPEPRTVHISGIEYDESTRSFQSQISVIVQDPKTGRGLGVLTVGVDVARALAPETGATTRNSGPVPKAGTAGDDALRDP